MTFACRRSPRQPSFRPLIEVLEDRCVPQASPPTGNISAIASQVFQDRATLNMIRDHLAAEARNPNTGPALPGELADLAAQSQAQVAELQADQAQVKSAAQEQIAALEKLFSQETQQTIQNLNDQILALDSKLAGLSPAQREAVAKQVSEQEFRLKDGAEVALKRFRDRLKGQEHVVVSLFDRRGHSIAVTLGRAEANEAEAEALEQKAEALGGGTAPGGGTQSSDPCTGQSPNKEFQTNDPRFPDGFITCGEFEALPAGQRPAIF